MKAFKIDPWKQEITEIELPEDEGAQLPAFYENMSTYVPVDCITIGAVLVANAKGEETLYVDDEGLLKPDVPSFRSGNSSSLLFGIGIVAGTARDGRTISSRLTLEGLKRFVRWAPFRTRS